MYNNFEYTFANGEVWRLSYLITMIPDFCGGKHVHGFECNMRMVGRANTIRRNRAGAEQSKLMMKEFGEAFRKELNRYPLSKNMRAIWWDYSRRPMYFVGEALKARAGRKFRNPNSGNTVSQFMIKI